MSEASTADEPIRCDACPVLCRIRRGNTGACDRYGNVDGKLVRSDPLVLLDHAVRQGQQPVRFLDRNQDWDGTIFRGPEVTGHRRRRHAPPIRTTSRRRSSCRARSTASTS